MISISGIRGIIPEGLHPENIAAFTTAFGAITGKKIVIGNDARSTGPMLRHLIVGTLTAQGKEILDIGLAPTPTVKAVVKLRKADGGIVISASHNPPEWNGLKLIQSGGFFFDRAMFEKFSEAMSRRANPDNFGASKKLVPYNKMGKVITADGTNEHIKSVLKIIPNLKEIRSRKYRIVVDAVAGAGRDALPALLEELGCRVIRLYCDEIASGEFPRPPEPTPSALKEFGKLIKKSKASVGFALDPDADRLVTGSPEKGTINEEYTLPLALMGLAPKPGRHTMVVNLSTANLIDVIAPIYRAKVLRSPVGEANVVEMMKRHHSIFGGEGNGGVIHPGVASFGRDSLTGAALILSAMAAAKARSLDELMKRLPPLYMKKTRREISGNPADLLVKIRQTFKMASADERDGLHLTFPDKSWLHVRSSNTEPIIRIIAQANSPADLNRLLESV